MSQTINPFEKIPPRFIVKDTIDILYKFGLSSHRKLKRENKLHKCLRYILPLCYAINSLKPFLLLILYKIWSEDQIESSRIFVYLGDFTYYLPQIRIHWNATVVQCFLISVILHLWHMKQDNVKLKSLDLLDCLSGKIEPYKIGLHNVEDIKKIIKR
jgi:hypothetical protein